MIENVYKDNSQSTHLLPSVGVKTPTLQNQRLNNNDFSPMRRQEHNLSVASIGTDSKREMWTYFRELDPKTHEFSHFGASKKPFDASKMMPKQWDLPDELFAVHMPVSDNPTINFIDAMKRKANLLNNEYRGTRKPDYMMHKIDEKVTSEPKKKLNVQSSRPQEIYDLGRKDLQKSNLERKRTGAQSMHTIPRQNQGSVSSSRDSRARINQTIDIGMSGSTSMLIESLKKEQKINQERMFAKINEKNTRTIQILTTNKKERQERYESSKKERQERDLQNQSKFRENRNSEVYGAHNKFVDRLSSNVFPRQDSSDFQSSSRAKEYDTDFRPMRNKRASMQAATNEVYFESQTQTQKNRAIRIRQSHSLIQMSTENSPKSSYIKQIKSKNKQDSEKIEKMRKKGSSPRMKVSSPLSANNKALFYSGIDGIKNSPKYILKNPGVVYTQPDQILMSAKSHKTLDENMIAKMKKINKQRRKQIKLASIDAEDVIIKPTKRDTTDVDN